MQRTWGRNVLDVFEKKKERRKDWYVSNIVCKGENRMKNTGRVG